VLALATLQAWSIRRLRALLINPNPGATAWQAGTSEEAGVIGAVAAVLGAMEPPPQLSTSVEELRLASAAYRSAADASRTAAAGDGAALELAAAGLTEGAAHTLLWLDALTATTGNDWGDGLRTLVEEAVPALVEDAQAQLADTQPVAEVAVAQALATPTPAAPVAAAPGNRQNRQARQNRQNRQARQNRRERANQPNQNAPE
jgi:hypothetical protein